ncbi:RNA polymerase sigma factor, partial [Echinicola sediminis]
MVVKEEPKNKNNQSASFSLGEYQGGKDGLTTLSKKNEKSIWEGFTKGDQDCLIYIYRNYANTLFRYGRQFTPRQEFIRDAIQELFYELIERRSKLSKVESIKGYLFVSLKRKILKGIKKEERVKYENEGFSIYVEQEGRSLSPYDEEIDLSLIQQALQKLPVNQREVILLYFYEGLPYKDIALIMGIKVRSARALAYRALDSLQEELGPHKSA